MVSHLLWQFLLNRHLIGLWLLFPMCSLYVNCSAFVCLFFVVVLLDFPHTSVCVCASAVLLLFFLTPFWGCSFSRVRIHVLEFRITAHQANSWRVAAVPALRTFFVCVPSPATRCASRRDGQKKKTGAKASQARRQKTATVAATVN
ncbi:hypothetical protein, unlikely [Trypanosoma congolense IL3000]|uniref:Uncharacterized protein n=1 Tax=Trypanosoma congolense (strain IL3000) TaxID=1068625 RepID=F9W3V8_TRYCI|nr:hypothetical protein, unlikely [Trypanosoma congolense IL3000]